MDLSLVIPVYNEEENLYLLLDSICQALNPPGYDWEVILVDDGSRDNSLKVLKEFAARDGKHARIISFRRNFGQTAAMSAGMEAARGGVELHSVIVDVDEATGRATSIRRYTIAESS